MDAKVRSMSKLDDSVRIVVLQFRTYNKDAVPCWISNHEPETYGRYAARKENCNKGVRIIEETPACSLIDFLTALKEKGFELVRAYSQERPYGCSAGGEKTMFISKYIFSNRAIDRNALSVWNGPALLELKNNCAGATWRIRSGWSNPFYENGKISADLQSWNIDLDSRNSLFKPDGSPTMVRRRDAAGIRQYLLPVVPLQPIFDLRIDREGHVVVAKYNVL